MSLPRNLNFLLGKKISPVSAKNNSQTVGTYSYDFAGRRITKTADSTTTKYYYDGDQVIAEYEGTTLVRKFIYGPGIDEPIMMIDVEDENAKYYYHYDALGSVVALSNSSGNIVESYSYDVFGWPSTTSSVGNPYLFTGRRFDTETGLYYYHFRYYSPVNSQWNVIKVSIANDIARTSFSGV